MSHPKISADPAETLADGGVHVIACPVDYSENLKLTSWLGELTIALQIAMAAQPQAVSNVPRGHLTRTEGIDNDQ
jgi:hypothetical protein